MRDFSLGERQLLATVRTLERHPQDWLTGGPVRPTRETLLRHGEILFGGEVDWTEAFEGLLASGDLQRRGEELYLSPGAVPHAEELRKAFASRYFGEQQIRCAASPAYRELCRRVFDLNLAHFSLLDAWQLGLFLEAADLLPDDHVLDAGCGIGTVTREIRERTGAQLTGVDLSAPAVEWANERWPGDPRLRFEVADLEELEPPRGSLDAILAIDVLYFLEGLEASLSRWARALSARGRMVFLASEVVSSQEEAARLPAASRLSRALEAACMAVETWDVTEREIAVWRKQEAAARDLGGDFEAEGNGPVAAMLLREAQRTLGWIREDRVRRYLYRATVRVPTTGSSRG